MEIKGTVAGIRYRNDENGYTVLVLDLEPNGKERSLADQTTVVGILPDLNPGESLTIMGRWATHPQYGQQFKAESVKQGMPISAEGLIDYLSSSLIHGLGPALARAVVKKFGMETVQVLDDEPERLLAVSGIGKKKLVGIVESWKAHRSIQEIMMFLQSLDVTTGLAIKIYKRYLGNSMKVVKENPYRLAIDISGVGFRMADQIARSMGIAQDDPERVQAGILHVMEQSVKSGHVFLPLGQVLEQASELLDVYRDLVIIQVDTLAESKSPRLVLDRMDITTSVYLASYHRAEVGVQKRLEKLLTTETPKMSDFGKIKDFDAYLDGLNIGGVKLSEQQVIAIQAALTSKVSIITGGPGTGKTMITRFIIAALDDKEKEYELAAPTGRAAKQLSRATGKPAYTIHRLLGYKPGLGFTVNEYFRLGVNMLIVDESSMLDLKLTDHLLRAVDDDAHVLFVGDVDQLPSVGAGSVLRDMIESDRLAVVRLDTIFRQAEGSHIITNSHLVNTGKMPVTNRGDDFFMFTTDDPEKAADLLVDVVARKIPDKFGLDPMADVQVLSPMHKGPIGVRALNLRLQEVLNPPSPGKVERKMETRTFRVGDKVMQIRNNYDKAVFNGDIGVLIEIDAPGKKFWVEIDGRKVEYEFGGAGDLVHAFACTIHKSQGSEFPVVVVPVMTAHYVMLKRNLIYTAITRARELVVLVGQKKAVGMAVRNNAIERRYSGLCGRLVWNNKEGLT